MGTVPTPLLYVTGQVVSAAQLNGQPGNTWGTFMLNPPICQVRQTTAQSLTNATWTDILFDTDDADLDNWHSTVTNTGRIIPQTPGQIRLLGGAVSFAANATGQRGARWALNGTAINATDSLGPAVNNTMAITARPALVVVNGTTDYVTLQGIQGSGGALLTSAAADAQSSGTAEWRGTG